jgi:integrase
MQLKDLTEAWLTKQRNRAALGKMKPASLATYEQRVNSHVLPGLGHAEIETKSIVEDGEKREIQIFRPSRIKAFAESLALGPKTTREVCALVKAILESSTDSEGEPTIQVKWRPSFIFENVREIGQQKQPTIGQDALNSIIKDRSIRVRDRVLIAVGAATGMRIGEILALRYRGGDESSTWDQEASVMHIRQSVWAGKLQAPKTVAAIREINLSAAVNKMLAEFCAGKKAGEFIFPNASGKPLGRAHVHNNILAPAGVPGAHSLRRFRASWCDEQRAPRSLLCAWLGHSSKDGEITNLYIKSAENQKYRREWAERIGTGLEVAFATLPQRGTRRRQIATPEQIPKPVESSPEPLAHLAAF